MTKTLLLISLFVSASLFAADRPQPSLFYVYGLKSQEEAYVWAYYLQSSWIGYPTRTGIYTKPDLPVSYVAEQAPAKHAPNGAVVPSNVPTNLIGYDYTGRAIYTRVQ